MRRVKSVLTLHAMAMAGTRKTAIFAHRAFCGAVEVATCTRERAKITRTSPTPLTNRVSACTRLYTTRAATAGSSTGHHERSARSSPPPWRVTQIRMTSTHQSTPDRENIFKYSLAPRKIAHSSPLTEKRARNPSYQYDGASQGGQLPGTGMATSNSGGSAN